MVGASRRLSSLGAAANISRARRQGFGAVRRQGSDINLRHLDEAREPGQQLE